MPRFLAIVFESVVSDGQRPLFVLLLGFIVTFGLTRLSTRLARAGVWTRFRPGSIVTEGGLHIHHAVFGLVAMIVVGILAFAFSPTSPWREMMAFAFGSGAALTLDEFALILPLEDVYWTGEGRASIDAVVLGVTFITLLLTGLLPRSIDTVGDYVAFSRWTAGGLILAGATFVVICYLKGKLFMGTVGIFVLPVAVFGAVRLAKPSSPWAHLHYANKPEKLGRARRREERYHRHWRRRKHYVWDLIGGKPHITLTHLNVAKVSREQSKGDGGKGAVPGGKP